jgi:transcriptional regulator with XRE-family HTH domain
MADGSPTLRRKRLGLVLRQLRVAAGLTMEQVAEETESNRTTVSRIELGRIGLKQKALRELLDLYGVHDEQVRTELLALARDGRVRGWWAPFASVLSEQYAAYIGFEAEASTLRVHEALVIHGLLQTEDYARALFRSVVPPLAPDAIEGKLKVRMARQSRLDSNNPLQYWAVLDESVLRRRVGSPETMHQQLTRLLEVSELPNVTIQIRSFASGISGGVGSSFTIIEFPAQTDRDIVYVESAMGDAFAEGEEVDRYAQRYAHLIATALGPERSCELIEQVRATWAD